MKSTLKGVVIDVKEANAVRVRKYLCASVGVNSGTTNPFLSYLRKTAARDRGF